MTEQPPVPLVAHGAEQLSLVTVDSYNAELRSSEGFVGDRASKRAFVSMLDDWRERVRSPAMTPSATHPLKRSARNSLTRFSPKEMPRPLA